MDSGAEPVRDLAEALAAESPLKLWSVIVTCLGDARRAGLADISGLVLSRLVERIGLQPQAMRVALHRLKRDGWIESRREGRVGFHGLSPSGLTQMRAVEARIYGPAASPAPCHLVGLPPDAPDGLALLPDGFAAISISRSFALVTGEDMDRLPDDWLLANPSGRDLPHWVREVVAEAACEATFTRLEACVGAITAIPDAPLDRFALRVLVLHGWRRLVLRSNPAAESAIGEGRAEIRCRACVQEMLERLGAISDDWLQGAS